MLLAGYEWRRVEGHDGDCGSRGSGRVVSLVHPAVYYAVGDHVGVVVLVAVEEAWVGNGNGRSESVREESILESIAGCELDEDGAQRLLTRWGH